MPVFVFRRFLRLRVTESLLLTTFFFTSHNVINGGTGTWSQRASVFLIPPMLLILLASRRMTVRVKGSGGSGQQSGFRELGSGVSSWGSGLSVEWVVPLALAALSGLLFSLLLTQEFYTGLFAAMLASIALVAYLGIGRWSWLGTHVGTLWTGDRRIFARGALVLALIGGMWTFYLWMFHGASLEVLNVRISSNNWRKPAILALASLATYTQLRGGFRRGGRFLLGRPWLLSVSLGACVGCLVFLWLYLGPYSDHPAFPRDELMNSFISRDLAHWRGPLNFLTELGAYDTLRPFAFAAIVGVLTWVPWFNIDRHSRVSWLWLIAISVFVLTISASFGGFTLWTFLRLDRLPGFSAIRDPKRLVYVVPVDARAGHRRLPDTVTDDLCVSDRRERVARLPARRVPESGNVRAPSVERHVRPLGRGAYRNRSLVSLLLHQGSIGRIHVPFEAHVEPVQRRCDVRGSQSRTSNVERLQRLGSGGMVSGESTGIGIRGSRGLVDCPVPPAGGV